MGTVFVNPVTYSIQCGYYPIMKCSIRILRKFKCEADSRPANLKGILTFDHAPASYFRAGCPLTLTLTKDEDRSAEYIGVPRPCRLINGA